MAGEDHYAETTGRVVTDVFVSLAVLFAIAGLAFLTRGLSLYAGRRVVGLPPTVDDISFARDRLVRKHGSARRGGTLAGIGLTLLDHRDPRGRSHHDPLRSPLPGANPGSRFSEGSQPGNQWRRFGPRDPVQLRHRSYDIAPVVVVRQDQVGN